MDKCEKNVNETNAPSSPSTSSSSSSSSSSCNSDEQSSDNLHKSASSKIGVYCTLRSRSILGPELPEFQTNKSTTVAEEKCPTASNNLMTYCTVGRRLKNFIKSNAASATTTMDSINPYTKLKEPISSYTNFGMSRDLSTESIRNACELYEHSDDDENDDDEIENKRSVEIAGSNFQRAHLRTSTRSSTIDRKRRLVDSFHPYCTIRKDRYRNEALATAVIPPKIANRQDSIEAYNILNELDAILDNQDSSEIASVTSTGPEQIEDYLFELDAYLEQIDQSSRTPSDDHKINMDGLYPFSADLSANDIPRSRTLPKKLRRLGKSAENSNISSSAITSVVADDYCFDRGHKHRSTIGSSSSPIESAAGTASDRDRLINDKSLKQHQRTWRRNSMRKTSLFNIPDNRTHSQHSHQTTASPSQQPFERLNPEHHTAIIRNASHPNFSTTTSSASPTDMLTQPSSQPHLAVLSTPVAIPSKKNPPSTTSLEDFNTFNTVNLSNSASESEPHISATSPELRRCLSDAVPTAATNNLTHIDIINDILQSTSGNDRQYQHRPRQFGRRAEGHPRVISIMAEVGSNSVQTTPRITINHDRPMSAPAGNFENLRIAAPLTSSRTDIESSSSSRHHHRYINSEPSSVGSSRNPSPVSLLSSTASSSLASTSAVPPANSPHEAIDPPGEMLLNDREESNINSQWPHGFSRTLALLCCTLGLFNISRFSVLTIHYGGNFLLQFLLLSIVFGIPMFWLQMCLGAKIKSGPISMWKISPICKGIGIALTLVQGIIALYTAISLAWCLIYFRDSFISRNDKYRWQEPYHLFRRPSNITSNLTETVADYFNGLVLQRWQLSEDRKDQAGGVRFQIAFNVAVVWIVVFIFLCKGLKSFGKVVLGLTLLPLVIFIVICCKFLYLVDFSAVQNIFFSNDFEDILVNSKSWTAAAQEIFLTWGLLGPSVIAISAKSAEKSEGKTILRRDAIIVVLLTMLGLSIAAVFGYACIQILQDNNYIYLPGSFEYTDTYTFLYSLQTPIPPERIGIPAKWAPHYSTVMGECYRRSISANYRESGFQALRLMTELFPATVAVATQEYVSPVWTLMTYLMFLIFGLGQMCAMWKPISSILGNSTSSVLLSCVVGLLLGIPFATEMGMSIIHYLDYILGGAWFLLILWTAQIFGVFLIRGRPYNGDHLVNDLQMASSISAFLALSWNVLLPIGLVTLAIIEYKITLSSQLFQWRGTTYFPMWTRKVGGLIQIGILLIVPITAIIQIYRYLSFGPPDLFDRIQLLYRPSLVPPQDHRRNRPNIERLTSQQASLGITVPNVEAQQVQDDAPPKYTPPPSYTTATGARLAKLLRQSIRRSVRRILGEPSRTRPTLPTGSNANATISDSSLPPEYSTVLTNPSGEECQRQMGPRVLYNSHTNRTLSLERQRTHRIVPSVIATPTSRRAAQTFTAFDVAQILRSSTHYPRHERSASAITAMDNILKTTSLSRRQKTASRSVENLVLNVAPIGESNAIMTRNSNNDGGIIIDGIAAAGSNESTSVI